MCAKFICICSFIIYIYNFQLSLCIYIVYPVTEQHSINLLNYTKGILLHLNYPQSIPANIDYTQHLVAPIGDVILLELYGVGFTENGCQNGGSLEVCI